jgi:hypothetical protein
MNIRPVGDEFLQADGQMEMTLIIAFRNFANAPKTVPDKFTTQVLFVQLNPCCP